MTSRCNSAMKELWNVLPVWGGGGYGVAGGGSHPDPGPPPFVRAGSTKRSLVSRAGNRLAAPSSHLFVKKLVIVSVVWHPEAWARFAAVETSVLPAGGGGRRGDPSGAAPALLICLYFGVRRAARLSSWLNGALADCCIATGSSICSWKLVTVTKRKEGKKRTISHDRMEPPHTHTHLCVEQSKGPSREKLN